MMKKKMKIMMMMIMMMTMMMIIIIIQHTYQKTLMALCDKYKALIKVNKFENEHKTIDECQE